MSTATQTRSFVGHLKWTVSRGYETNGWNICSLWIDGKKVATCMGGGYDMVGTTIGNFIQKTFQDRLLQIADQARYTHTDITRINEAGYYGMGAVEWKDGEGTVRRKVTIDGGCGIESVRKIAVAIGITWDTLPTGGRTKYDIYHFSDER